MDSISPLNSLTRTHVLVLLVVWMVCAGYMAAHLKRGWVPHDEGTLGLSAERVLQGKLPHRDFDDYTGGLTFLHALAFRELGISSGSMRIVLFVFFVLWVPAVFYVASWFVTEYLAAGVTLLAIVWSVPNYPGPLPSWYNLFFATFGVAALLHYLKVGNRRWLVVAGICAGLSALAKIAAAYFIAGTILFFIFREQCISSERNVLSRQRARFYTATVALGLAAFLAVLFRMIHSIAGMNGLIYFVLPASGLVAFLLVREFAGIPGDDRERFIALIGMCAPFAVGVAIPLLAFSVPFLLTRSVHDLMHGLVATPARAIRFASYAPQNPFTMVTIVPFMMPVIMGYECGRVGRVICGIVVALSACGVLFFAAKSLFIYRLGWFSLATSIPVLIVAGLAILWITCRERKVSVQQQGIMLMMCITALCSLVQFPFAAPVYFFYVAPLVILSAAALFASSAHPPKFALGTLMGFYLLFAVLPSTRFQMGIRRASDAKTERLAVPRAGNLVVESSDARLYGELIPLVQSHALGKYIFAAPDCPEVYFLSGLQSPTRHYFEYAEGQRQYTERIMQTLDRLKVNVIVIDRDPGPELSGPLSPKLQSALERRYSHSAEMDHFLVRWNE
jgi:hypothetical protein